MIKKFGPEFSDGGSAKAVRYKHIKNTVNKNVINRKKYPITVLLRLIKLFILSTIYVSAGHLVLEPWGSLPCKAFLVLVSSLARRHLVQTKM